MFCCESKEWIKSNKKTKQKQGDEKKTEFDPPMFGLLLK